MILFPATQAAIPARRLSLVTSTSKLLKDIMILRKKVVKGSNLSFEKSTTIPFISNSSLNFLSFNTCRVSKKSLNDLDNLLNSQQTIVSPILHSHILSDVFYTYGLAR